MSLLRISPLALSSLLLLISPASAFCSESADENSEARTNSAELWNARVAPLLKEHCWSCHGEETQESDLRLDTVAGIA
ncbi:MAG: c-type cytochrome domain-containing protein, partial [Planctomycetaceae bacterium]